MTAHVAITDYNLPRDGRIEKTLEAAGLTYKFYDCETNEDVIAAAREADALIIQWASVGEDVLAGADRLKIISRLGVGWDMVDIAAADQHGVVVANTPDYCLEEVATHSISMALYFVRAIGAMDRQVRDGEWAVSEVTPKARRTSETTFSVVGFGRIGSKVAKMASSLGFNVLVADPHVSEEAVSDAGAKLVALEDAISDAHVLSLHAPLTDETRHLINADALSTMREDSFIVNTCRGELIDEEALVGALEKGMIGGAALDVFATEPLPSSSRLREFPNVLLNPHGAWYSQHALDELPIRAAKTVINYLRGEPIASIVNNPSDARMSRK